MKAYFTRRRVLILLFAMLLTASLALILRDFVRSYVVLPLLDLGWVAWIGLLSVPQAVFWGLFLLLALIVAARSLSSGAPRIRGRFDRAVQRYHSPSRYGYWQTGLKSISRSSYAHERVERELQTVVLHVLAEQRHVATEELRSQFFQETLDLTNEAQVIRDLFKLDLHAGYTLPQRGLMAWLARLFGRGEPSIASNLDVPGIVLWLEEQAGILPAETGDSSQSRSAPQQIHSAP